MYCQNLHHHTYRHDCNIGWDTIVRTSAVFLLGSKVDFYHWNSLEIHSVNVGHQLPFDDRVHGAYTCQQLLFNYNITPGAIGTSSCSLAAEHMWVSS